MRAMKDRDVMEWFTLVRKPKRASEYRKAHRGVGQCQCDHCLATWAVRSYQFRWGEA